MKGLSVMAGSAAGLALALALSEWLVPPPGGTPARLLSDAHGALVEIEIQYCRAFHPEVGDTLEDLFRGLPAEVAIRVVVESRDDYAHLRRELLRKGVPALERLSPVITGFPVTPWARDRFVAMAAGKRPVLGVPSVRNPSPGARGGDEQVPGVLAALLPGTTCRPLPFQFEGGDWLADEEHAFVMANGLARNSPEDTDGRTALIRRLEEALGKKLVALGEKPGDVPDHHICMVLTPLGGNRVAVADPDLGLALADREPAGVPADRSRDEALFEGFRNIRRGLEREGFQVVSVPILLTTAPRVFASYNNALLERREGENRIYMPVYGIPALDRAARAAYEAEGWRVIPVRAGRLYRHGGSLRCQVGILRRR